MKIKRIMLSLALSITLHVVVLATIHRVDRDRGIWRRVFDVIDLPADLWALLIWPGHGIPQLVLPFFFSLACYIGIFWVLLFLYDRWRRRFKLHNARLKSS